ncbi:YveK family protein [Anaerostipes sp.]|uniref:YveK family protein n=1 Tax=Anaerostipes sp. TaxID=1872530 RepID=UPI00258988E0|nr:Wzz/FepE/Etk N-terminal domain-containing protein [Anaerostipes sp.]MCI5623939.1 Wzz/FepE/Etk N-terminal domain-containing protein [Anaerostipes sp.]
MDKKYTSNVEEVTINLGEIIAAIFSKIWLIIISGITLGLIAFSVSKFFMTPIYESTTKIYILSRADSSYLTTSDMSVSSSLAQDYAELVKSRTVTENVISQLDLDMTTDELLSKMKVEAGSTDTRILAIKVSDEDPYVASKIADTVREVAADHIAEVMDTDSIKVVETANIPTNPSSPNSKLNAILGAMLGMIICCIIVVVIRVKNDTIMTQEEVEKYLDLSVIGMVPIIGKEKKSKKKAKKKRRKQSRRGRR